MIFLTEPCAIGRPRIGAAVTAHVRSRPWELSTVRCSCRLDAVFVCACTQAQRGRKSALLTVNSLCSVQTV